MSFCLSVFFFFFDHLNSKRTCINIVNERIGKRSSKTVYGCVQILNDPAKYENVCVYWTYQWNGDFCRMLMKRRSNRHNKLQANFINGRYFVDRWKKQRISVIIGAWHHCQSSVKGYLMNTIPTHSAKDHTLASIMLSLATQLGIPHHTIINNNKKPKHNKYPKLIIIEA